MLDVSRVTCKGRAGLFYYDNDIFGVVVRDPTPGASFRVEEFFDNGNRCLRIFFFKPGSTTDYFGEVCYLSSYLLMTSSDNIIMFTVRRL